MPATCSLAELCRQNRRLSQYQKSTKRLPEVPVGDLSAQVAAWTPALLLNNTVGAWDLMMLEFDCCLCERLQKRLPANGRFFASTAPSLLRFSWFFSHMHTSLVDYGTQKLAKYTAILLSLLPATVTRLNEA